MLMVGRLSQEIQKERVRIQIGGQKTIKKLKRVVDS